MRMQRPTTADIAVENFRTVREQVEETSNSDLTETDTRCKAIDPILRDLLGWDESQIERESRETEHGTFLDYLLTGERAPFVVEAKRMGETFTLPPTGALIAGSNLSLSKNKKLKEHISQASSYSLDLDLPIAVISNGLQWVIIDSVRRSQGKRYDSIVIRTLDELEEHLPLFWAILSPFGKGIDALREAIPEQDDLNRPGFEKTLLEDRYFPNEVIEHNPNSDRLQPLLESYFGDLIDNERLLAECYCETGKQAQYSKEIQSLLRNPSPNLGAPVKEMEVRRRSAKPLQQAVTASMTGKKSGRLILLLGGVGVGKTTFLHRFFHHILDEETKGRSVWLYVDFLKLSAQEKEIAGFIASESLDSLDQRYASLKLSELEQLHEMYELELNQKRRGVWKSIYESNRAEYDRREADFLERQLEDSRRHLLKTLTLVSRNRNLCPILLLDNSDQLDAGTQKKAFLEAVSLSKSVECTVIVALREETYLATKDALPFDTHQSFLYYITAPDLASVFRARLKALQKRREDAAIELQARLGARVSQVNTISFFENVIRSIQKNRNSLMLFECLSARDIRQALEMFRAFLTSGHTNTDEFIAASLTSAEYAVPLHVLVRSLALRDRKFYSSNETYIYNVFSYSQGVSYSHTTRLRVLRRLLQASNSASPAGKGFVSVESLYSEFSTRIVDEVHLRSLLHSLATFRLVQGDQHGWIITSRDRYVKATAAAAFYLQFLVMEFGYLDQVLLDTPIKQPRYFDSLDQLTKKILFEKDYFQRQKLRVDRVKVFLKYLESEERKDNEHLQSLSDDTYSPNSEIGPILDRFSEQEQEILEGSLKSYRAAGP